MSTQHFKLACDIGMVYVPGYGRKSKGLRKHWANCASKPDDEILAIDRLEDELDREEWGKTLPIRNHITGLELCHHKAERHVELIIHEIGRMQPISPARTKFGKSDHPMTEVWQETIDLLIAWGTESVQEAMELHLPRMSAIPLNEILGQRTSLKAWQAQRIADKMKAFLVEYGVVPDPTHQYIPLNHPDANKHYNKTFLEKTQDILIQFPDQEASLLDAIEWLQPCHACFPESLLTVLHAINGNLIAKTVFGGCGQTNSIPNYGKFLQTLKNLQAYLAGDRTESNSEIFQILGSPTRLKTWLVASIEKTMRLQMGL